jgi:predicted YcjX-like family ATPase
MASRFVWTSLKDLTSLPSPARLQRGLKDLSDLALDRTLRLAVTGLRGSGKTVFITMAVHHLLRTHELPFLSAVQEGRLLGVRLLPPGPDDLPAFPFASARAALTDGEPRWPPATERLSTLRLQFRFVVKGALRRRLGERRLLTVQIIDYPGEWLLDLPLLDQTYEAWSAATLRAAETAPRAAHAGDWRSFLATLDPDAPASSEQAGRGAALYADYLRRCQGAGLSLLQPGRFTMPGDLAGSELLQFCPLLEGRGGGAPGGSLAQLMRNRYERYRSLVVLPFYRDHFSRFDRQIVLVDLLGVLNHGRACFADCEAALALVLGNFRYGPSGLLARLLRPRIETLLFAATKADHVAHNQHPNLRLLLERLVEEAAGAARFEGVKPAFLALAALRSTDVVRTDHQGQVLSCVQGVLKGEDRATVLFPGEIPPELPAEEDWRVGRFRFRDFAPRRLTLQGAERPQHIRLDQALEVLLGDRLR